MTDKQSSVTTVLSLAQLLEQQPPTPPPCLVEPGLLPPQGILFVGGEPKVGKSLLVANLALALASGSDRTGFSIPAPRRVLICQFELPVPQFVGRLAVMRRAMGSAADLNLLVDTRATGHLLCAPQAGHPAVVALMGSSFSQRQSDLLLSHFASVTLMLDGDQTGRHAAEVIATLLRPKVRVNKVELPNRVQPDQLSSAEINVLIGPASLSLGPSISILPFKL